MLEFKRTFTDFEQKVLEHDLLDIEVWINGMIDGKINNGLKRIASKEREILILEEAKIAPVSFSDLVAQAFERPEYKNRIDREKKDDATGIERTITPA